MRFLNNVRRPLVFLYLRKKVHIKELDFCQKVIRELQFLIKNSIFAILVTFWAIFTFWNFFTKIGQSNIFFFMTLNFNEKK